MRWKSGLKEGDERVGCENWVMCESGERVRLESGFREWGESKVREWSVRFGCERKVGDLGERVGYESGWES